MELYSIVQAAGWECFGTPPKALEHSSVRKHLHAGVKDALALLKEGQQARVSVYRLASKAMVPVVISEVSFTRRNRRACDLMGDGDWLIPLLSPARLDIPA